jgi:hypothetical protein
MKPPRVLDRPTDKLGLRLLKLVNVYGNEDYNCAARTCVKLR